MTLLDDEEWSQRLDGELAELAAVTKRYVNKLRNEIREQFPNDDQSQDKHANVTTMNTENIGQKSPRPKPG